MLYITILLLNIFKVKGFHFQGNQFCCFHFLPVVSMGFTLKGKIYSYRSKFFSFRVDHFRNGLVAKEANFYSFIY